MANRQVLREYLVKLGWDVDEQGFKTFQSKFEGTIKQLTQLGKVAAVAGVALSTAVIKAASDIEKLYFSAERAGTSVSQLMAIRFGAEQIGVGADNAAAMIERMGSALRSNPGLQVFFQQLGLTEVSDNTKNFINLVTKLRDLSERGGMSHAIASQIAAQFGIDEPTLLMLEKNLPDLIRAQQQAQSLAGRAGLNLDEQGPRFHQFMEDVRTLWQSIELLADASGVKLLPAAEGVVHFLQNAVNWMLDLNQETDGWSTALGGILVTLGGVKAAFAGIRAIGGLFGAGAGVAEAGEAVGAAGAGAIGISFLGPIIAIVVAAVAAYFLLHNEKVKQVVQKTSEGITGAVAKFEGFAGKAYRDIAGNLTIGYGHMVRPGENFSGGVTQAGALKLLAQDMANAQAAVLRMVKVALNPNQLAALTDFAFNLGSGTLARSTLLSKLNSGDYAGAAAQFGRFNEYKTGSGYAVSAGLTARRDWERDTFNKPVSMQQTTNIHVNTSGDADDIGKAVGDEQSRVNGDMLRNLSGITQ
jgi:lysozyme